MWLQSLASFAIPTGLGHHRLPSYLVALWHGLPASAHIPLPPPNVYCWLKNAAPRVSLFNVLGLLGHLAVNPTWDKTQSLLCPTKAFISDSILLLYLESTPLRPHSPPGFFTRVRHACVLGLLHISQEPSSPDVHMAHHLISFKPLLKYLLLIGD